jgi:hypothetical protein
MHENHHLPEEHLLIAGGAGEATVVALSRTVTLDDHTVSRRHALLVRTSDGTRLIDDAQRQRHARQRRARHRRGARRRRRAHPRRHDAHLQRSAREGEHVSAPGYSSSARIR